MKRTFQYIIFLLIVFSSISLYSNEVDLIFKHPFKDSLTNSYTSRSMVQLFAYGNEELFKLIGTADDPWIRAGELTIFVYFSAFNSALSHEYSHYRITDYYGLYPEVTLSFFGGVVVHNYIDDIDKEIRSVSGGLNQQELNVELTYESVVNSGELYYYDGFNLMMNHMGTTAYTFITYMGHDSNGNDIINYETLMQAKGVDVDRGRLFAMSLASVFSTALFWQNLILAYDLVADNQRSSSIWTINDYLAYPLFNYYLTEDGDYLGITVPVLKPIPIFIQLGHGLARSMYRLGFKAFLFKEQVVNFNPFVYFNKNFQANSGFQIGSELRFQLIQENWHLFFIGKYSENDFYDRMKVESGFNSYIGTKIIW